MPPLAKRSFISSTAGVGVLCGFAAIFIIFMLIACAYGRYKNPRWQQRAQRLWVTERRAEVQRMQAEVAETRREVDLAMRMNQLRQSRDQTHGSDVEIGLGRPEPAYTAAPSRSDMPPSYEQLPDTLPEPHGLHMMGSNSSVPAYTANPR